MEEKRNKARGGIEPPSKDLQSPTLPLCYLAQKKTKKKEKGEKTLCLERIELSTTNFAG
jgi:hypothetical protein